jgi:aspartate 4-decarboxylase
MTLDKWKRFEKMSPFEVKNELIEAATNSLEKQKDCECKHIYNAGRGNPNFLNTTVRKAFAQLMLFISELSDKYFPDNNLGLRPPKSHISEQFKEFIKDNITEEGVAFLNAAIEFAEKEYKFDPDDFMFEMADAALGDFYPSPSRIFPYTEEIIKKYLEEIICPREGLPKGEYHIFATEGAAAAMFYLFNSLKINKVLNSGDHIAIVTPIFSPYLEMPILKKFGLKEVYIEGKEDLDWQIPDSELEKLKDPKVKALYIVNPTNPSSVALSEESLKKIAQIVKTNRKDLIVLTDTVYATFVDDFHSIFQDIPENTICVYSYSKYFGVTGWRLGTIMLKTDNIIDKMIANLSENDKKNLDYRYSTVAPDPRSILFIDRLELDSREPSLAHTGGLSGPQQAIMCLFSIFNLMDKEKNYKKAIHNILKKRIKILYDQLEIPIPEEHHHSYYYTLLDFSVIAKHKYGAEFANYLSKKINPLEFLFKLAEENFAVCLPGSGFAGPKWSIRVSLANLNDDDYYAVGKGLKEVLEGYHKKWEEKKK